MSVHYKFKNTITYDAIKFDGVYISATDLKAVIASQKKLSHSELQVANEETNEVYTDDQLIPKNTNVVVLRVPFANSNKRARMNQNHNNSNSSGNASGNNNHHHNNHHHNNHHHHHHHNNRHHDNNRNHNPPAGGSSLDANASGAREAFELVSTKDMTEEEKIKHIQSQSTRDFDPARYARGRGGGYRGGRGGGGGGGGGGHRHFVPGPGYTCRKCGIPGHSIYDCKMSTVHKVKRSSGIPRDFLVKVDSKEKGALMTPSGEYAVPYIDRDAYKNPKVEKAPFFEDGTPSDDDPPAKRQAISQ